MFDFVYEVFMAMKAGYVFMHNYPLWDKQSVLAGDSSVQFFNQLETYNHGLGPKVRDIDFNIPESNGLGDGKGFMIFGVKIGLVQPFTGTNFPAGPDVATLLSSILLNAALHIKVNSIEVFKALATDCPYPDGVQILDNDYDSSAAPTSTMNAQNGCRDLNVYRRLDFPIVIEKGDKIYTTLNFSTPINIGIAAPVILKCEFEGYYFEEPVGNRVTVPGQLKIA